MNFILRFLDFMFLIKAVLERGKWRYSVPKRLFCLVLYRYVIVMGNVSFVFSVFSASL